MIQHSLIDSRKVCFHKKNRYSSWAIPHFLIYTQSLVYFVKTNSRKVYRFQSKVIYLILIKYVLKEKINIPNSCAIPCLHNKTNSRKVYRFQSKVIHLILISYVFIEKINIPTLCAIPCLWSIFVKTVLTLKTTGTIWYDTQHSLIDSYKVCSHKKNTYALWAIPHFLIYTQSLVYFVRTDSRKVYRSQSKVFI